MVTASQPCPACGICGGHFCMGPPALDSYATDVDNQPMIGMSADDELNNAEYQRGYDAATELHHTNYCCAVCDYHVMPHRRCILR